MIKLLMNKLSPYFFVLFLYVSILTLNSCYQHVTISVSPTKIADILSEHQDRAILLILYRTTCPWCLKELSELPEVEQSFKDNLIDFIGFSLDKSPDDVDYYVQKNGLPFTPYWLDFSSTEELSSGFETSNINLPYRFGVPLLIILDKEHRQINTLHGYQNKEALTTALKEALP